MSNALIRESSPYLLQHAENPVDWLPWGDAAFERAAEEGKMVFLSIGYSTCHWCHVMESESFESEEIARVLNEHFICVKVDREERPDVDATYMAFVQALTGSGGWPMSVWLTPQAQPVVGGTYFPPEDREGRVGLQNLSEEIAMMWQQQRPRLLEEGEKALQVLQGRADEVQESPEEIKGFHGRVVRTFQESYDCDYGGFGAAPKFPRPPWLELLVQLSSTDTHLAHGEFIDSMLKKTLDGMSRGGIHDHLAGGFHRYSVDAEWRTPHYEKMLYDQALLLKLYTRAWLVTKEDRYREVASSIGTYLRETLRDDSGAFHAGEDADSLDEDGVKKEGAYWTWSETQLLKELEDPEDYAFACAMYGVEQDGNTPAMSDPHGELTGRNTLFLAQKESELGMMFSLSREQYQEKKQRIDGVLRSARQHREPPHRDDKVITTWNAYTAEALLHYTRATQCDVSYQAATQALEFLLNTMWDGENLTRCWRLGTSSAPAVAQDYAALIRALQVAYQVDASLKWLEWGKLLQLRMDELFWDSQRKAYTISTRVAQHDVLTMVEDYDGPEPSTNSVALENLDFWYYYLEPDSQERASCQFKRQVLSERLRRVALANPEAIPLVVARELHPQGTLRIQCSLEQALQERELYLPGVHYIYSPQSQELEVCDAQGCWAESPSKLSEITELRKRR